MWTVSTKQMDAVLAPPPYSADGNLRLSDRLSLPQVTEHISHGSAAVSQVSRLPGQCSLYCKLPSLIRNKSSHALAYPLLKEKLKARF